MTTYDLVGKTVRVNGNIGEVIDANDEEVRVLFAGYEDEGCSGFKLGKIEEVM
jgi:hypothetical protein